MNSKPLAVSVLLTSAWIAPAIVQGDESKPSVTQLMEQADYEQRVTGDHQKAIQIYERVLRQHKKNSVIVDTARQHLKQLRASGTKRPDPSKDLTPAPRSQQITLQPRVPMSHRIVIEDLSQAVQVIKDNYAGDPKLLDPETLRSLVKNLDQHSGYLDSRTAKDLLINVRGNLVGIGAALKMEDGALMIQSALPNTPAHDAGLKPGDQILLINGEAINDIDKPLRLTESVRRLRGKDGESVTIEVLSDIENKTKSYTLKRRRITLPVLGGIKGLETASNPLDAHRLPTHPSMGYIHVASISQNTSKQFRETMEKLEDVPVTGMILDLRGCAGGLFQGAVEIADCFLDDGLIVSSKGRKQPQQEYRADKEELMENVPLAILIDSRTASAGEIVAGALKQNGRAIVVGERSFGKGSVQALFGLASGGMIKLTTAEFFLAGDVKIQKPDDATEEDRWGVDPSEGMRIKVTEEERAKNDSRTEPESDTVLQKAVEVLKSLQQNSE